MNNMVPSAPIRSFLDERRWSWDTATLAYMNYKHSTWEAALTATRRLQTQDEVAWRTADTWCVVLGAPIIELYPTYKGTRR
jgi:hypothetical protein